MDNGNEYLFVYGTLRKDLISPVSHLIAGDVQWKSDGVINAKLYDIGDYPGAIRSAGGSKIRGEVIKILRPRKVWKVLDRYEGCDSKDGTEPEYKREKELVTLTGGKVLEAWVYWYNLSLKDKRRIRNNDYLKYLRKKQMA